MIANDDSAPAEVLLSTQEETAELPLLTQDDAAELLRVSPWTLQSWRTLGKGPPYLKFRGLVRYRPSDVNAWIRDRMVTPGPDRGRTEA